MKRIRFSASLSLLVLALLFTVSGCSSGGSSSVDNGGGGGVGTNPPPPPPATAEVVQCGTATTTLPANMDVNTDLEVTGGTCNVAGGTYIFRNVNIWGGGLLNFSDAAIDFHAHSILVENGGILQAGASTPVNGPISIWLYGNKTDGVASIQCKSSATCGVPSNIWASNPNVPMKTMPTQACTPASTFDPTTPVGTDCFYQYEVLDTGDAAGAFFGKKVLAVSWGGTINLHGAKGVGTGTAIDANPADSRNSWVRLADTIAAGATSFHVDRAIPTWAVGDHIVVTTTDYQASHTEELVIAGFSNDSQGTIITTTAPVKYPHWGGAYDFSDLPAGSGPRDDPNGPPTRASRHLENRAAVALLTRSIMVASEGDSPVLSDRTTPHFPTGYYGGHTLIRAGVASYQVQGVEFYQLGQGGAIGRYPIHFHMDRQVPASNPTAVPPYAGTYVADSSIHESNTRFITVHATQGLLLARNVGYISVGHGYYLEDATEINNRLYSNIGIQSIGGVNSALNTRQVPGILSQAGNSETEVFPYHSDYDHPSIFWIMNTWNDFQYNVAVGAGTCGACYWLPAGMISGPSQYETWSSYAAMQGPARFGAAPLMNFVGNSCSCAMNAIQTVGNTTPCFGVTSSDAAVPGKLAAIANLDPLADADYPQVDTGQHQHPTICAPTEACDSKPLCTGQGEFLANCATTVIDHFSTSFNWAEKNFSAVWLRGWWYLLTDSSITDVQNGGLTMVSGGGYTRSDVPQGFWNLSQHNLFVGNTQPIQSNGVPANPAASNAGPYNPFNASVSCPFNPLFCLSMNDGTVILNEAYSNSQRLINIYDGPTYESSDVFRDIHVTDIGSLSQCKPGGNVVGGCNNLGWMNAFNTGVLQSPAGNSQTNRCILPNAAIAWKQPNGFYYPPAFHLTNLLFDNVDIRHYVVLPLWLPGTFTQDQTATLSKYCTWQPDIFTAFTDVDRQTELTDDIGSLTGLVSGTSTNPGETISVNNDNFFNAPLSTPECESSAPTLTGTAITSPYEYVTTALFAACGGLSGSCSNPNNPSYLWGNDCGDQSCYGVPLYRQFLTNAEYLANPQSRISIRMMGQGGGQRSTMTLNHGSYYMDTSPSAKTQNSANPNIFQPNQTYYMYFVYAKPSLHQVYSFYIGTTDQTTALNSVKTGSVIVANGTTPIFSPGTSGQPDWILNKQYNAATGVLSLTVDLAAQAPVFNNDKPKFCQPASYCTISQQTQSCVCAPNTNCKEDAVCNWADKDIDCPLQGCFGFSLTLPATFANAPDGTTIPPPAPIRFVGDPGSDPYFANGNITFFNVDSSIAGSCRYATPPTQQ